MAKPDKDEGWIETASELVLPLFIARIGDPARYVLGAVLLDVYGPFKRRHAEIDVPALAGAYTTRKGTPMDPSNVRAGIKELLAAGICTQVGESYTTLTLVKDYEKWTKDGKPMFSETEVALFRKSRPFPGGLGDQKEPKKARNRTPNRVPSNTDRVQPNTPAVFNDTRNRVPSNTVPCSVQHGSTIGTPAREKEERQEDKDTPPTPLTEGGRLVGGVASLSEGEAKAESGKVEPPPMPVGYSALCFRASRLFPDAPLAGALRNLWNANATLRALWEEIPPAVWDEALDAMAKPGKDPDTLNPSYFLAIVKRLKARQPRASKPEPLTEYYTYNGPPLRSRGKSAPGKNGADFSKDGVP